MPDLRSVPAKTEASKALSKALKKRGFVFVGETRAMAFMQSMGLVERSFNDCPCKLASVYADHAPINRRILQRLNAPITPLIKNPCLPSKKTRF